MADLVLTRLGARRSSWNAADIRGEVERIIAAVNVVTAPTVRRELAEDLTTRAIDRCVPLLARDDVPEHVRALTSRQVLDVEADLTTRLAARAEHPAVPDSVGRVVARRPLDHAQRRVVAALAGTGKLLVIEGAAGAGKTTTLAAAHDLLEMQQRRLVVVTPTLKAARVAPQQVGAAAFSAAWLAHQHGYRWDDDGRWTRVDQQPDARRRGCCPATSCSSTRPACSTRTPPAPCSPSPTRPAPASRSSATGTSSPPSAAAACSTSPHAGSAPRRTSTWRRSTGSPTPSTPTSAC